ncbi:hypothetical protein GDO86_002615 [Hymenochirus boettgeri]|uniref:Cystatin domain-containing protein n=1 Tax=Hymenochirus boettgeri TaxID=247094 RepID=A0A8T2K5Z6_9PIPI|nr:hypothetical protein GDO86_002615 [Hymenochirus boettgeri]
MMTCGGLGGSQTADSEVQGICDQMKGEFLKQSGVNASVFKAIEYKTQVVAGTNYFIKVHLGGDKYAHIRVYQSLPHAGSKLRLDRFQVDKTKDDKVDHF